MSGHSHWATIKHKKQASDAKKGKLYSKISRMIMIAVKEGRSTDPDTNAKLANAIQKARDASMPMANVESAIKRASGQGGEVLETATYAGVYQGVSILVNVLTDNKNRAVAEISKIFERNGAKFTQTSAVMFKFEKKGKITVEANGVDEEKFMDDVANAGADNYERVEDMYEVTCSSDNFSDVKKALTAKYKVKSADISLSPTQMVTVDEATAKKLLMLIEEIEDHDDVQDTLFDADIPESVLQALSK